eukprot:6213029-Pleurochrysis_carterae.AAC.4
MRRWKRAFDMGNLRRGRRASCLWRTTKCCFSPSTARRRCSASTMSLPARSPMQAWVQHPTCVWVASWQAPQAGTCTAGELPARWRQRQWDFRVT